MNEGIIENQAGSSITPETSNINNTTNKNQFSDTRLTMAAVFALLPYFGMIGLHNFILKQYRKGITHIAIVIVFYLPYIIVKMSCDHRSNCYNMVMPATFLRYLAIASYIWAIVEGVQILQSKKQKAPSLPTTTNPNATQSPKPVMNDGNEREKNQDRKVWSILSIIATMIPIILWVCCFIVSGGSTNENGPGAIWWLMIMYYWSLGIPLAVVSIAFGIIGLKTSLRWLSIVSLLIKATMIIAIVLLVLTISHPFR